MSGCVIHVPLQIPSRLERCCASAHSCRRLLLYGGVAGVRMNTAQMPLRPRLPAAATTQRAEGTAPTPEPTPSPTRQSWILLHHPLSTPGNPRSHVAHHPPSATSAPSSTSASLLSSAHSPRDRRWCPSSLRPTPLGQSSRQRPPSRPVAVSWQGIAELNSARPRSVRRMQPAQNPSLEQDTASLVPVERISDPGVHEPWMRGIRIPLGALTRIFIHRWPASSSCSLDPCHPCP